MKNLFRLLLCPLAAFIFGCATPHPHATASNGGAAHQPAPLLLISIDGYRHDYLQRGLSPTLAALAHGGANA